MDGLSCSRVVTGIVVCIGSLQFMIDVIGAMGWGW